MPRNYHPFFHNIGTADITWSNYSEDPPPASAFNIPDQDKCARGTDAQCSKVQAGLVDQLLMSLALLISPDGRTGLPGQTEIGGDRY